MSKLRKVYNTKLLYRWSLPFIFTMIFIGIMIAALAVPCFLPVFKFGSGEVSSQITLLDMIYHTFQLDNLAPQVNEFIELIRLYTLDEQGANNPLFGITKVAMYVIPICLMIAAIFGLVLVIFFFVGLFSGRFHHWKGPLIMSIWEFIFGLLGFGSALALSIYLNIDGGNSGIEGFPEFEIIYTIIYLSAMFVTLIFLEVIYYVGFNEKEFIPNKRYLANYVLEVADIEIELRDPKGSYEKGLEEQLRRKKAAKLNQGPVYFPVPGNSNPQPIIINNGNGDGKPKTKVVKVLRKISIVPNDKVLAESKAIGGNAYSKNIHLQVANIPLGVTSLGVSAFSNCVNLKTVSMPKSVTEIGYNCFFNCKRLERINFSGTKEEWKKVKRGSNWLAKAGTTIVVCSDGAVSVNPYH